MIELKNIDEFPYLRSKLDQIKKKKKKGKITRALATILLRGVKTVIELAWNRAALLGARWPELAH